MMRFGFSTYIPPLTSRLLPQTLAYVTHTFNRALTVLSSLNKIKADIYTQHDTRLLTIVSCIHDSVLLC